jgi:hypothetical protein
MRTRFYAVAAEMKIGPLGYTHDSIRIQFILFRADRRCRQAFTGPSRLLVSTFGFLSGVLKRCAGNLPD